VSEYGRTQEVVARRTTPIWCEARALFRAVYYPARPLQRYAGRGALPAAVSARAVGRSMQLGKGDSRGGILDSDNNKSRLARIHRFFGSLPCMFLEVTAVLVGFRTMSQIWYRTVDEPCCTSMHPGFCAQSYVCASDAPVRCKVEHSLCAALHPRTGFSVAARRHRRSPYAE
jgi:hypothetical protein